MFYLESNSPHADILASVEASIIPTGTDINSVFKKSKDDDALNDGPIVLQIAPNTGGGDSEHHVEQLLQGINT